MLDKDRLYLEKFAIDPVVDIDFDSYDVLDYGLENDIDPDADSIDLAGIDEDFLTDQ
jgi:hypothetical protein